MLFFCTEILQLYYILYDKDHIVLTKNTLLYSKNELGPFSSKKLAQGAVAGPESRASKNWILL